MPGATWVSMIPSPLPPCLPSSSVSTQPILHTVFAQVPLILSYHREQRREPWACGSYALSCSRMFMHNKYLVFLKVTSKYYGNKKSEVGQKCGWSGRTV